MKKSIIPILLVIAFLLSLVWLCNSPDYEPAITSIAFLISFVSIFIDRQLKDKETRKNYLVLLIHELNMNLAVVEHLNQFKTEEKLNSFHVYPRFYNTSLSHVLASQMFQESKDQKLWNHMHGWLQASQDYNNRLNISEMQIIANPSQASKYNTMITEGVSARTLQLKLFALVKVIFEDYESETQINYDTTLFSTENEQV